LPGLSSPGLAARGDETACQEAKILNITVIQAMLEIICHLRPGKITDTAETGMRPVSTGV